MCGVVSKCTDLGMVCCQKTSNKPVSWFFDAYFPWDFPPSRHLICFVPLVGVLEIEPRTFCMLCTRSASAVQPQPHLHGVPSSLR